MIFSLRPSVVTCAPKTSLFSWSIHTLKMDFNGFTQGQKVLVKRDAESPHAKRGVVSFWVLSPELQKCVNWGADIFNDSVYKARGEPVQNVKYDKLFWKLIGPALQFNLQQRIRYGYVFYEYQGADIQLNDGTHTIILRKGSKFTIFQYGKLWSVRSMNKKGVLVDVDGFTERALQKVMKRSVELPPVANLNADNLNTQVKIDNNQLRDFA